MALCSLMLEDAELRERGWRPIDTAPLEAGELVGLTVNGNRLLIYYFAGGDYLDRWVGPARYGIILDLTHWRPLPATDVIAAGPLGE